MDTIAKSDIFFFVTTISVILLKIWGIIIIVYIFKIVSNVKDASDRLKSQAKKVSEDIDELRESGYKDIMNRIKRIGSIFKKQNKKNHEKKHKESNS
jgi:uncharacterized membrane protein